MSVPNPPSASRWGRTADSILLILVLGLAGLVSSFVARNSDVWQHLAVGRLVANGDYDFASDPLSYATEGRWVNHAWLTDWLSYQLFQRVGGAGLVASKAALVMLAVGIGMVRLRRDQPRWSAALLILSAVVALSSRATLQPLIVSCVLLAILLQLLQSGGRAYRYVPILVVVWVNLDDWYLLGPIFTGLHWLGHRWQRTRIVPIWLPLLTLTACLANPFHVHGLTLPAELSPAFWSSDLKHDPRVAAQFNSYFAGNPLVEHGDSVAFWAYCGSVLAGSVSLVANRRAELWQGLVWVAVVALSAWQARLVPLCAIVAVSLIAPQIQYRTPKPTRGRLGRAVTLMAILGCAAATWSGWLQGARGRDRIVGWSVYADPTLVKAAERLNSWRTEGDLPSESHVFGTTPDVANTFAWFAKGERGYFDTRWDWHARAGQAHSLNLVEELGLDSPGKDRLKRHRIAAVLLVDPSPRVLASILTPGSRWRVLAVDGRAIWLGSESVRGDFDPERLAFGTDAEQKPRLERFAQYREWWRPPSAQRPDRNPAVSSAAAYLNLQLATNSSSSTLPLLAIRSARRTLLSNPDDAQAWLDLAKGYAVLGATVENRVGSQSGVVAELRRTQRVTALTQATVANPESEAASEGLATTLTEMGYSDRALAERRRQFVLVKRRGDSERINALAAVIAELEDEQFDRESLFQVQTQKMSGDPLSRARIALGLGLAGLAQEILLKSSSELYKNDGVRLLATLLLGSGQAPEAQTLLQREELQKNPNGLGMHEIASQAADGQRIVYRMPAYDWFQFLLAASANRSNPLVPLERLQQKLTMELGGVSGYLNDSSVPVGRQVLAEVGLAAAGAILPRVIINLQREQLLRPVNQSRFLSIQRADLVVLGGWCALEAGQTALALRQFDAALADYARSADLRVAPAKPLAELYGKQLKAIVR